MMKKSVETIVKVDDSSAAINHRSILCEMQNNWSKAHNTQQRQLATTSTKAENFQLIKRKWRSMKSMLIAFHATDRENFKQKKKFSLFNGQLKVQQFTKSEWEREETNDRCKAHRDDLEISGFLLFWEHNWQAIASVTETVYQTKILHNHINSLFGPISCCDEIFRQIRWSILKLWLIANCFRDANENKIAHIFQTTRTKSQNLKK